MTEDEVRYVCSIIPLQDSVGYFKQYPKEFAKIMPGFRATSLKTQEQVAGILFKGRNQRFVSSFLEKHISRWLDEISDAISEEINDGNSREIALLQTLSHCFFIDNIELYFKLTGAEYSEEFIAILSASIRLIKDSYVELECTKSLLDAKTSVFDRKESELERVQSELDKNIIKLNERFAEIKALKSNIDDFEKMKTIINAHEQTIEKLEKTVQQRDEYIQKLKSYLSEANDKQLQLEEKIREIENRWASNYMTQETTRKPKCPKKIDDFKEFLGYNLENIGVSANEDYYRLLKDYLSEILFQGKPVIISRSVVFSLIKCISNTLVKTQSVSILTFTSDITEETIDVFLSQDKRIICLDNFIGNYNETILLSICDRHKDKIIFLSVAYDRTLCYVPIELMKYCHYLNLNRISAFTDNKVLTEDPSIVDEVEISDLTVTPNPKWAPFLQEMLDALGIQGALSAHKSSLVADESSLCRILAFDVLPYCVDVLKIAPFTLSERLVKYAGESGRCPYKNLLRRWFA
jgi:hypothetical protein